MKKNWYKPEIEIISAEELIKKITAFSRSGCMFPCGSPGCIYFCSTNTTCPHHSI